MSEFHSYVPTRPHPRFVAALKSAGLRILIEHKKNRMFVDMDQLLCEALAIFDDPNIVDIERLIADTRDLQIKMKIERYP